MQLIKKAGFKRKELNLTGKNPVLLKKSFNEDVEVGFEPIDHTYFFHDQKLDSATGLTSKFYDKFDLELVAKSCSKYWEKDPQDIVDLWDSNKKVSSLFGTAIHNAIEHYEIYEKIGAEISAKREVDENYALPNHPLLKQIILDFIKINPIKGEVVTEALITWIKGGICGHADRIVIIDKEKKICRVGDYKINVEAEKKDKNMKPKAPFQDLPNTKISKYQLQLSIYSNMLEYSGWTVEGLDAYVYEDGWKYYELPVLKVI
jgi:hypothetical protein